MQVFLRSGDEGGGRVNLPSARERLAGCFQTLLEAHDEFKNQGNRPNLLIDAKAAQAQQQALIRRLALSQQQALLALMECVGCLMEVLQPTQRAGAEKQNGTKSTSN